MLGIRRWSNRRKAALAVALALFLWIPSGISTQSQPVITGHTTFFNGTGYDPCLASVAGILSVDVLWFNDMYLVRHYGGKGTFIYITEADAPDPTTRSHLYTEGVEYRFTDPNGASWHVVEAFMELNAGAGAGVGAIDEDDPESSDLGNVFFDKESRHYVWIVELAAAPIHDQFAGAYHHDIYNFVNLVDTCKFDKTNPANGGRDELGTNERNFTIEHDADDFPYGHPVNATEHTHDQFNAMIWVGKRPILVPAGINDGEPSSWESEWSSDQSYGPGGQATPPPGQSS